MISIDFYHYNVHEIIQWESVWQQLLKLGVDAKLVVEPPGINKSRAVTVQSYERIVNYCHKNHYPIIKNGRYKTCSAVVTTQYYQWLKEYTGIKINFCYGVGLTLDSSSVQFDKLSGFDVVLTHGDFTRNKIIRNGINAAKVYIIGYPKFTKYFCGSYNLEELKLLFRISKGRKTISYFPTWHQNSSIDNYSSAIEQLGQNYNVLIKPHHNNIDIEYERHNHLRKLKNIVLIDEPISNAPIFFISDLIITDTRSGCYPESLLCRKKTIGLLMKNDPTKAMPEPIIFSLSDICESVDKLLPLVEANLDSKSNPYYTINDFIMPYLFADHNRLGDLHCAEIIVKAILDNKKLGTNGEKERSVIGSELKQIIPNEIKNEKEIPSLVEHDFIEGMTSIIISVQSFQLNECVSSLKKYTDEPHEIIFLEHNASPKLKKLIVKATKWNHNYKFIKVDKRANFTQSLNEGINQSTGEYIVFLFDDVIVYEGWLSDMLECLHSGKEIGIVGAMSDDASSQQRIDGIDFKLPESRLSFREKNRRRSVHTRNLDGFCMLFRRNLLIQIGLFDVIFGKDKHVFDDFCVRAVHKGYNNVIAGNVFVHNAGGINRLMSRDKTLFDEKWMSLNTSKPSEETVLTENSMSAQLTAPPVIIEDVSEQSPPGEVFLKQADADTQISVLNVVKNVFGVHHGNDQISDRLALCRTASFVPNYPDLKTITFFMYNRERYRPIMFSTNEIFCGPDCETIKLDGKYKTIKTPIGVYDVSSVIDQLPPSQMPELIVVRADATRRNFPINLKQFNCPKILIVGDTQHLNTPVQTLLRYALQEQFDFILSDHKRHHLHFFKEAGLERVFWLPGINAYPHEQPVIEKKEFEVTFVGQVGRWHPIRKTILQFLKANSTPIQIMQTPHEKAAEIYAKSLINLNISLNGDLNLRVFEVLSSGGFLLTDRLSRESGLEMIFKDGEHLVCYDSLQDLLEKIRYYLKHPSEANAIAKKGHEEYKRHHTPETKTNELMNFIFKGRLNPLYEIQKDNRSIHVRSKSKEDLFQRISAYEYFQDVHLKNHEPAAFFFPSVDPRLLCDVSDLPRLRLYIGTDIPDKSLQLFNNTNIADRIHALSLEDLKKIQGVWDIIVLTASDLVDQNLEDFLISMNFKLLVVSNSLSSVDEDSRVKLLEYFSGNGLEKIHENPYVFFWKDKSLWGEYLFSKGLKAEAVKNFERALVDNPANENALNNLGVISYQLNRYEAAEKFMVKAVSLNRRDINSLNNLVQLYMAMERFEEAAGLLLEITGINPEQPEPWYLLGLCQERLNQLDEAFDAFKKAEKLGGDAYPIPEGMHTKLDNSLFVKINSPSKFSSKNILIINNLYPPQYLDGYEYLLFDFTNILRNRGHSIYVLTSDSPYLGKTDGDKPDVHRSLVLFGGWEGGVCKTMENRDDIIRIVRKNTAVLEQVLKEFRPDACLLGNIDFLSRNIMNPMLDKKIPIIHHLGNQQPGYAVNETPKNRLYHLAAVSNWLKNEIQRQGYPLKDISVVFPGALVEEFRMRISPALDKLRIVYASIVIPYKGPHILINALKKLHDAGIDFSCSIAGSSTDKGFVDSLKSFVTGNGMEDKIRFLDFLPREELKNLFARHNVLVFPSLFQEPFGISQVEAMAAGLIVVTSGTGGAKEIVEHGVSGIIFKTEDDASLADELIQLAKYPLKCQQIALAGQRRAIEKFDIERSVDALESCFARLLQTKGIH
jgi:glycosyltransferase involved in cell wall biosynthesis